MALYHPLSPYIREWNATWNDRGDRSLLLHGTKVETTCWGISGRLLWANTCHGSKTSPRTVQNTEKMLYVMKSMKLQMDDPISTWNICKRRSHFFVQWLPEKIADFGLFGSARAKLHEKFSVGVKCMVFEKWSYGKRPICL